MQQRASVINAYVVAAWQDKALRPFQCAGKCLFAHSFAELQLRSSDL